MRSKKIWVDLGATAMAVCAIITGFLLHSEVHHLYIYDDITLWTVHEVAGVLLALFLLIHCVEHKFWFLNYSKILFKRKWLNSTLFILAIIVISTGVILLCGSHSQFVSILHYIMAIAFAVFAFFHVVGHRKTLMSLMKK